MRYLATFIVKIVFLLSIVLSASAHKGSEKHEKFDYQVSSKMNDDQQLVIAFTNISDSPLAFHQIDFTATRLRYSFWIDGKRAKPYKLFKNQVLSLLGKKVIEPGDSIVRNISVLSNFHGLEDELKNNQIVLKWYGIITLDEEDEIKRKHIKVSDEVVLNPDFLK